MSGFVRAISRKVVSAEERTNRLLQIDPDQPLLEIRRLIYLRRTPVVLAISRLPLGMFPGLDRLPDDEMIDTPLYLILENHFGRPTIANHELFSVARADSITRGLLDFSASRQLAVRPEDLPPAVRLDLPDWLYETLVGQFAAEDLEKLAVSLKTQGRSPLLQKATRLSSYLG